MNFYTIAGITIQIKSDLPITHQTFGQKFNTFNVNKPGKDNILIHYHFNLPNLSDLDQNLKVFDSPPWVIHKIDGKWIYLGIASQKENPNLWCVAEFNHDHTYGQIYRPNEYVFLQGDLQSLTLLPTDQIVLARVLADLAGCYFHAAGMIIDEQGFLFMGHSGIGKSTIVKLLMDDGDILCDDRIIVRRWPEGFKIHGTWSHGEIPIVSNASAPLRAILLLEQALTNRIIPIENPLEIVRTLPFYVIKPLVTAGWWEKTLDLVGQISREVPVYHLQFDKSGQVREVLKQLV